MTVNHTSHSEEAVYVYEAPLRLWHWVNAFAILALAGTGYLIGSPPPSVGGDASASFVFGWIRYLHFAAGYVLIAGFAFRIYWAFAGNEHARQLFLPPVWRGRFWREVWHEVLWYAMLVKEPIKYSGHNPLATIAMHILFVWFTIFMIVTGLALYGEGTGMDSWQHTLFSSRVIPLFGQSQDVHTWHHLGMWVIICFVIIHIYVAVREDIMSRQTIISSMFSGWRTFRGNGAPPDSR
ncbi:putative Ni/Fe-hydrogenase B-type cytochrome subunit [Mesorhizobium tianshanense]|uniref:Probable Ni/Fe-hydrogenase B-type cytochrome subunit n=1 Tax=Mesorhizobium tianshanense TaxID=39844 RepID=A0A562MM95_9HYPH|nr:Ni/Fe-hydrogenase, b-type cytochrome subunit [Mesorhizobium tianshanense]TWI21010.1 Ni/Fe-hydrogenase 1 B-type cytochrome subunit [Mesorhizobium tianshanense]GLS35210.1 putative Ni/Fe-hydrogenase B-type cytochrome subunit [Mesorhizobium tianshanense]